MPIAPNLVFKTCVLVRGDANGRWGRMPAKLALHLVPMSILRPRRPLRCSKLNINHAEAGTLKQAAGRSSPPPWAAEGALFIVFQCDGNVGIGRQAHRTVLDIGDQATVDIVVVIIAGVLFSQL